MTSVSSQSQKRGFMQAVDLITAKRDGTALTDEQISWFVAEYTAGRVIGDEQAAALLMAICLNGMEPRELSTWTAAMIASGRRLDLSSLDRPTVDKHSTGGIGDKISLILVPLVAACGAAVPQLSGRGLGHTGGTLDKMSAIQGWRAEMSPDQMLAQLSEVGCVIASASEAIAPADRKLYALRDVTGTVESIPLIASSIMSKKIAEGCAALTLDVKVGSGAFMKTVGQADELARTMVAIGADHGVKTSALVTRMDTVLGRCVGNALEVREAIDVLEGRGPEDVIALTLELATEMLAQAELAADPASVLASGEARETFDRMTAAQGGDLSAGLPASAHLKIVTAMESGHVVALEALAVGTAAWRLGAGRARKDDHIDPTAGVVCLVQLGDRVSVGDPVFELHASDQDLLPVAARQLAGALKVSEEPPPATPLVVTRISGRYSSER